MQRTIVVVGTGGTIAGVAARAEDHVGYEAAALAPEALAAAVPALAALPLRCESLPCNWRLGSNWFLATRKLRSLFCSVSLAAA